MGKAMGVFKGLHSKRVGANNDGNIIPSHQTLAWIRGEWIGEWVFSRGYIPKTLVLSETGISYHPIKNKNGMGLGGCEAGCFSRGYIQITLGLMRTGTSYHPIKD